MVPSNWQMVRRSPAGVETVLARGVASFDLYPDERIVFTDGSAVYSLDPGRGDGRKLLARGSCVQAVAALDAEGEPRESRLPTASRP